MPTGNLTPHQYEILRHIWDAGRRGATVGEIWKAIYKDRSVSRTTVLNLVDRLVTRGWLRRAEQDDNATNRFVAAVTKKKTDELLAESMVNDYFDGSASNLVMSLLGGKTLKGEEIQRLRRILNEPTRHK
jgi:BlaI family penicillinase repressor